MGMGTEAVVLEKAEEEAAPPKTLRVPEHVLEIVSDSVWLRKTRVERGGGLAISQGCEFIGAGRTTVQANEVVNEAVVVDRGQAGGHGVDSQVGGAELSPGVRRGPPVLFATVGELHAGIDADATSGNTWFERGVPTTGFTLRLVGAREARALNRRFRGKDRPTNVLSFPYGAGRGDIVLCHPVIAREARAQDKRLAAHSAHLRPPSGMGTLDR